MSNEINKETLLPEEADIQERLDGFNKELKPILGKYELNLAAMPKILPDGRTVADPIVVSARKPKKEDAKVDGGLENPEA